MSNDAQAGFNQPLAKLKAEIDNLHELTKAGLNNNLTILISGHLELITKQFTEFFMQLTAQAEYYHDAHHQARRYATLKLMAYALDVISSVNDKINTELLQGDITDVSQVWGSVIQKIKDTKQTLAQLQSELPTQAPIQVQDLANHCQAIAEYCDEDVLAALAADPAQHMVVEALLKSTTENLTQGLLQRYCNETRAALAEVQSAQSAHELLVDVEQLLFHKLMPLKLRLSMIDKTQLPHSVTLATQVSEAVDELLQLQKAIQTQAQILEDTEQAAVTAIKAPERPVIKPQMLLPPSIIKQLIEALEGEYPKLHEKSLQAHAKKCSDTLIDVERYYNHLCDKIAAATDIQEIVKCHQERRLLDGLYKRLIVQYDNTLIQLSHLPMTGSQAIALQTSLRGFQDRRIKARNARKACRLLDKFTRRLQAQKNSVKEICDQLAAVKALGQFNAANAFVFYQRLTRAKNILHDLHEQTQHLSATQVGLPENMVAATPALRQSVALQTQLDKLIDEQISQLSEHVHNQSEFLRYTHYQHHLRFTLPADDFSLLLTEIETDDLSIKLRLQKLQSMLKHTVDDKVFVDVYKLQREKFDVAALIDDVKGHDGLQGLLPSLTQINGLMRFAQQITEITSLLDETVLNKVRALRSLISHEDLQRSCLAALSPEYRLILEDIFKLNEQAYATTQQLQLELKTFLLANHDLTNAQTFSQLQHINFQPFIALCSRAAELQTKINGIDKNSPDSLILKRFMQQVAPDSIATKHFMASNLQSFLVHFIQTPMRFPLFDFFSKPEKFAPLSSAQQAHCREAGAVIKNHCQAMNTVQETADIIALMDFVRTHKKSKARLGVLSQQQHCPKTVSEQVALYQLHDLTVDAIHDIKLAHLPLEKSIKSLLRDCQVLAQMIDDFNLAPELKQQIEDQRHKLEQIQIAINGLATIDAICQYHCERGKPMNVVFAERYKQYQEHVSAQLLTLRQVTLPTLNGNIELARTQSHRQQLLQEIDNRELRAELSTLPTRILKACDLTALAQRFTSEADCQAALEPIRECAPGEFATFCQRVWLAQLQHDLIAQIDNAQLRHALINNPGLGVLKLTDKIVSDLNQGYTITPDVMENLGLQITPSACRQINAVQRNIGVAYAEKHAHDEPYRQQLAKLSQHAQRHLAQSQQYFAANQNHNSAKKTHPLLSLLRRLFPKFIAAHKPQAKAQFDTKKLVKHQSLLLKKIGKLHAKMSHSADSQNTLAECRKLYEDVYALQAKYVQHFPKQVETKPPLATQEHGYELEKTHKLEPLLVISLGFGQPQLRINKNLSETELKQQVGEFFKNQHSQGKAGSPCNITGKDPELIKIAKSIATDLAIPVVHADLPKAELLSQALPQISSSPTAAA